MPTGTLVVSSGVSSINGTDLARQGSPQPFNAATNFIANRGFGDGDFVTVVGSNGNVGNVPVIFITAISAAAGGRRRGTKKAGKQRAAKQAIKKAAKKSAKKSAKKTAKKKTTKKSTKKSAKKPAKKR